MADLTIPTDNTTDNTTDTIIDTTTTPTNTDIPPPPPQTFALLSYPTPQILLITFNRPSHLNALPPHASPELTALCTWYDFHPTLRCAVVTGAGRAFCCGADLHAWHARTTVHPFLHTPLFPPSGVAGLSRRGGRKPVIVAVNGLALGGGFEIVANADLVVAARSAQFALPEVDRGVAALEGALPRLARTLGRQRAMELALTGRRLGAEEAREWGLVNAVMEDDAGEGVEVGDRPVVRRAVELARCIAAKSPDSVVVSRAGVVAGWEEGSVERATGVVKEVWEERLNGGDNLREGIRAFAEKRKPRWRDSRL